LNQQSFHHNQTDTLQKALEAASVSSFSLRDDQRRQPDHYH
jgi:hypothetical protein